MRPLQALRGALPLGVRRGGVVRREARRGPVAGGADPSRGRGVPGGRDPLRGAAVKHDPRYLMGMERFNAGEFFEAHEVWEDLWIEVNGEEKAFYQGLIQAAVALHHARADNPGGARKLYERSRA